MNSKKDFMKVWQIAFDKYRSIEVFFCKFAGSLNWTFLQVLLQKKAEFKFHLGIISDFRF